MKGIDVNDLRHLIIRPTLDKIGLMSSAAENLLLGTAAIESLMGYHLRQITGPALGIYQIEPITHDDVHINFLDNIKHIDLKLKILGLLNFDAILGDRQKQQKELIGNLYYATAIARLIYYRAPSPLPVGGDIDGLAHYWKKYYNTELGKGTVEDFVRCYNQYVLLK